MKAPLFGKVIRLNLFGQFARTLSTLLENGVPVLTALKITEQIIPNVMVKEAIAKTREEVTDGKTIEVNCFVACPAAGTAGRGATGTVTTAAGP